MSEDVTIQGKKFRVSIMSGVAIRPSGIDIQATVGSVTVVKPVLKNVQLPERYDITVYNPDIQANTILARIEVVED